LVGIENACPGVGICLTHPTNHYSCTYSPSYPNRHVHVIEIDEKGNVGPVKGEGEGEDGDGEGDGGRNRGGGFFMRCCPRLLGVVDRSWKMYPIGLLFGLGFDTATEVALLGMTAMGNNMSVPPATIMILPSLFAAGMSLIDTLDGMMMLWTYSWAQLEPQRRIFFNLFLTIMSAVIAIIVAVIEILGRVQDGMELEGSVFWDGIKAINENFEIVGYR
jgi:HoxN/HupN/NixA family high-affinity nickel-transporter